MSADLTKASELFRHFALNSNDNEASNALLAVVKKLRRDKVDFHKISLSHGSEGGVSVAWATHLQNQVSYWKKSAEDREAQIEKLNKHALQTANTVRQLEHELIAAQAKKPQTPRATTEWVRQVSYSPFAARQEKERIDDAVAAKTISREQGIKFKSHVSRRTGPVDKNVVEDSLIIYGRADIIVTAVTYSDLTVEYVVTRAGVEIERTDDPSKVEVSKEARAVATAHREGLRHA